MGPPSNNPLDGVDRLLIDGNNLLHALRQRDAGAVLPAAALVGRIRAVVPAAVAIELVFDGPSERGMRGTRVASGLIVRYGGRHTADDVLLSLVDEARAATGPAGADNILVVSDDRQLRYRLRERGAGTAGTHWLLGRLERRTLDSPATGNPRPPRDPHAARAAERNPATPDDERERTWRPGRGATVKRGNPKRPAHRRRRPPIHG